MEYIRKKAYIVFVVLTCSFAFTSLGGAVTWTSPSLVKLMSNDTPIPFTSTQLSWVSWSLAIGTLIVAIPYAYVYTRVGRTTLITSISLLYIAGWVTMIFGSQPSHIYVGRFFLGCAVGPTYGVIPVYLSEVMGKSRRGAGIVILVVFQSFGAFIHYGFGPNLTFATHNMVSIIFPLMLFFCSFLLPETPYYLLSVHKEEKAKQVLMKLRGVTHKKCVDEEFNNIKLCLQESRPLTLGGTLKELPLSKTKKIFTIIAVSTFAQQFSGAGAISEYMESIFIDMQVPMIAKDAVLVTEAVSIGTVFVTFMVIDKVGRKPLLLMATLVCMIASVVVGLYFFLREDSVITNTYTWIGLVGMFLVQVGFSMGLGPVLLLVISEVLAFNMKGWLSGFYLVCQVLFRMAAIKMFRVISDDLGRYFAHWLFAGALLLSVFYLMFFMPETRGMSLQEIQHMIVSDDVSRKNDSLRKEGIDMDTATSMVNKNHIFYVQE